MTKIKNFFKSRLVMVLTTIFMLVGAVAFAGVVNIYINDGEVETSPVVDESENFGGSGGVFQTDWYKVGNRVTFVKSGQFRDASTTLISFVNPFGTASTTAPLSGGSTASSTVVSVNLDITGVATSTYTIACGASSDIYADNTYSILSSGSIVTSTKAVIENNMTNSYSNGVTGGTVDKMALTPEDSYFVCKVTTDYEAAFTNDANTFDGSWSVEIRKNLQ